MNRRVLAFSALAICAVVALFVLRPQLIYESLRHRTDSMHPMSVSSEISALNRAAPSTSGGHLNTVSIAPNATAAAGLAVFMQTNNAAQQRAAETDQQFIGVAGMLRDYRAATGEEPIGNNSEITKALLGANPRGVHFNTPDMKMDNSGQLLDRWGHPYFFHQISKIDMEVRSAGPDGIMWTADDEVLP